MTTKDSVFVTKKNGIYYQLGENNKIIRFKPWLGDIFSFLYDRIMEKSVFPKKFDGSISQHFKILKIEFQDLHHKNIVELACGSGNAVEFLPHDNKYTGVDISKGLLLIAKKKFDRCGFGNAEFCLADVCDLPFLDHCFDITICNLSLNFFQDMDGFISELKRVLKHDAVFYCSIAVPEKTKPKARIHGILYTAEELKKKFQEHQFVYEELPYENGALLYFKATAKNKQSAKEY
jgi:ubiquinone/menaquinone biosynthesis C-methylase UbiE